MYPLSSSMSTFSRFGDGQSSDALESRQRSLDRTHRPRSGWCAVVRALRCVVGFAVSSSGALMWICFSMTSGRCRLRLAGCRARAGGNGEGICCDAPVPGELGHVPGFEGICLSRWCRIRRPGLGVLLLDFAAIVTCGYRRRAACDTADVCQEEPFGASENEVVGSAGGHRVDEIGERVAGDVLPYGRRQAPGVVRLVPQDLRLAESFYYLGLRRIGWQWRGEHHAVAPDVNRLCRAAGRRG